MNCLLIDQGNSRTKLAWRSDTGLAGVTEGSASGAGLADLLDRLDRQPDQIWLASVAAATVRDALLDHLSARFTCGPSLASVPQHQAHLPTRYAPQQLGVDRWLALLAARQAHAGPLLVVDAGTATTIDLLDGAGQHLGGYILPGFGLMRSALLDATAIQEPALPARQQRPPRDTVSAIALAGPAAVAALIAQQRAQLASQAGTAVGVVLGGGAAQDLAPLVEEPRDVIDQLVLRGLAVLSRLEEARCAG